MPKKLILELGGQQVEALLDEAATLTLTEKRDGRRPGSAKVVIVDLAGIWKQKDDTQVIGQWDLLLARLPVADLGTDPQKVGYRAKVWLLNQLKNQNGNSIA